MTRVRTISFFPGFYTTPGLDDIFLYMASRWGARESEAGRMNPPTDAQNPLAMLILPRLMTGGGVVAWSLAVRGDHLHSSHILVP